MELLNEMLKKRMVGYADRFSVEPGNEIKFYVSCEGVPEYRADIVRLFSGDHHPDGAGFREELLQTSLSGTHVAHHQEILAGSYAVIDELSEFPSLPRALSD